MRDQYGRPLRDLRISLTDRCNLRCVYCVPEQGISHRPPAELLQDDELILLVELAAELGVEKIRLTGGEPMIRAGIVDLVRRIVSVPGIQDVAMTTNGILLEPMAGPLAAAGLNRVNVSIDTLDPEKFRRITRGGQVERVLAGVQRAEEVGLGPIKINSVVIRGHNENDVVSLAALTLDRPWEVRFIEMMPFASLAGIEGAGMVPSEETRARIEAALGRLEPLDLSGSAPSRTYRLSGALGRIGLISSMSEPFCARCGRLRLTSDGRLRLCLLREDEEDLLAPLRAGASRDQMKALFEAAAYRRPVGQALDQSASPVSCLMGRIGG